jgi:hypothetical protein
MLTAELIAERQGPFCVTAAELVSRNASVILDRLNGVDIRDLSLASQGELGTLASLASGIVPVKPEEVWPRRNTETDTIFDFRMTFREPVMGLQRYLSHDLQPGAAIDGVLEERLRAATLACGRAFVTVLHDTVDTSPVVRDTLPYFGKNARAAALSLAASRS